MHKLKCNLLAHKLQLLSFQTFANSYAWKIIWCMEMQKRWASVFSNFITRIKWLPKIVWQNFKNILLYMLDREPIFNLNFWKRKKSTEKSVSKLVSAQQKDNLSKTKQLLELCTRHQQTNVNLIQIWNWRNDKGASERMQGTILWWHKDDKQIRKMITKML